MTLDTGNLLLVMVFLQTTLIFRRIFGGPWPHLLGLVALVWLVLTIIADMQGELLVIDGKVVLSTAQRGVRFMGEVGSVLTLVLLTLLNIRLYRRAKSVQGQRRTTTATITGEGAATEREEC